MFVELLYIDHLGMSRFFNLLFPLTIHPLSYQAAKKPNTPQQADGVQFYINFCRGFANHGKLGNVVLTSILPCADMNLFL